MATTPTLLKKVFDRAKEEHALTVQKINSKRVFIDIDPITFKDILVLKSERIFNDRSEPKDYRFDSYNKDLIQQLYYYVTGNSKFKGSLQKGIHLYGTYGCGKTALLQSVCEMITELSDRKIEMVHAKEFGNTILKHGIDYYYKRPMFLDDIGREPREVKNFGNVIHPVPDSYPMRKENGAWTFQTCQRPIKGLESEYGEYITDRMRAAFNEIEFKGSSRR